MLLPMIVFSSVTKEFRGKAVLSDLSFSIAPGEFVCITGPSGAGKSTVIHLLIRAEQPTAGTIEVDGADIATLPVPVLQTYRRRMGVVFQDYKLLLDRTVEENIAFALEVAGATDDTVEERVAELLKLLKIEEQRDAFPSELSGGEKTRVALARALVHRPSILVADEPTGNIDPAQSLEIIALLKEENARGTTVILASHDKMVVDALGARVLRLEQGKLVRDSVGGYEGAVPEKPHVRHPVHHVKAASHPKSHHAHHKMVEPGEKREPASSGHVKPVGVE